MINLFPDSLWKFEICFLFVLEQIQFHDFNKINTKIQFFPLKGDGKQG